MANDETVAGAESASLRIDKIGMADLSDALKKGYDDFVAMPSHAVFLGVVYPVIGLIIGRFISGQSLLPMLFPVMAGFALVGPFAATALYELSRRRELGVDASPSHILELLRSPAIGAILELGAMLLLVFFVWLVAARAIYHSTFNDVMPASVEEFVRQIFTTPAGWTLIVVGNGVGLLFAMAAFSLSVVSFPLIVDRHVSALKAVLTSLRAVGANPGAMIVWGLIIEGSLALGSLPFFVGLIVVLPVLGHASWHLYRKIVPH